MHPFIDPQLLHTLVNTSLGHLTFNHGFFCQTVPWNPFAKSTGVNMNSSTIGLRHWRSMLELLLSIIGFLGAILLFFYYSKLHRRRRRSGRRDHWTTDQINACLIPLWIGSTFAVIYFVFG